MLALSVFVLLFHSTVAQPRELQLYPAVTNYSLFEGQSAFFNCSSSGFDTIQWTVNSTSLNFYQNDPDLSYDLSPLSMVNGRLVSTLSIQGTMKYNDSVISCIALEYFKMDNNSDWIDSHFLIQGVPGKVLSFQGDNVTATSLRFWWYPPPHNPGVPPCCTNYSINITNMDTGSAVFTDHYTTVTFMEFNVSLAELCSLYSIQVSAYNDVGRGETLDTTWSRGGFFRANEARESLFYTIADTQGTAAVTELNLGVNVTIGGYCLNDLDNMTLSVECQSISERLQQTQDIIASKTERELHRSIGLVIPDSHKDRPCAYDVGLENNVDLPKNPFNTFDTRSVEVYTVPGMVCASCMLLPLSPGRGCVLVVSRDGISSGIEYIRNISITDDDGGCVEVPEGRYRARVHDWQPGGGRSEGFVYSQVIDVPRVDIMIPSPSDAEPISSGLSSGAIAGIVIGCIVAVAISIVALVVLVNLIIKKNKSDVVERTNGDIALSGNQIQFDSSKAPTVELYSGKPVSYDELKEMLEDIKGWDYTQSQVKMNRGEDRKYKYVLITQSIEQPDKESTDSSAASIEGNHHEL